MARDADDAPDQAAIPGGIDRRRRPEALQDALRPLVSAVAVRLQHLASQFGYRYHHFGLRMVVPPGRPVQVFIDGGPPGAVEAYESQIGMGQDPVLKMSQHRLRPFGLDGGELLDDPGVSAFRGLLRDHGIIQPVLIPLHAATSTGLAVFSAPTERVSEDHWRQMHWMVLEALENLFHGVDQGFASRGRRLSDRQSQALALSGTGLEVDAIALKMGVEPSTARYLLMRAVHNLGARTRAEALVRATVLGQLETFIFPQTLKASTLYYRRGDPGS